METGRNRPKHCVDLASRVDLFAPMQPSLAINAQSEQKNA